MSITLFDESGTIELTTRQRTVPLLSSAMDTDTLAPCSESMERLLVGTLVDSVHKLRNMDSEYRAMCCFQDVRVKYPGTYRLRFSLMQLPSTEIEPSEPTTTLGHIFSDPFRVYSLKDFPGVDGSTLLTKWIAGQGVAIPLRNKGRLKQEDGSD
ncbi:hypothetical protein GGF43_006574 [Coemansia sp. RSA 2618]|nr:hypothetical protein GGF43_006574 [Coemansia sp. RSA 2618]